MAAKFLKGKVPDSIIDDPDWRLPDNWWGYIIYLTPAIQDEWKRMVAGNKGLQESKAGEVWGPAITRFKQTIFKAQNAKAILDSLSQIGQIEKVPAEVMIQIQNAMDYKGAIERLFDRLDAAGKKSEGVRGLLKDLGEFVFKAGIGGAAAYSALHHFFQASVSQRIVDRWQKREV
jgi:hypothetical protein